MLNPHASLPRFLAILLLCSLTAPLALAAAPAQPERPIRIIHLRGDGPALGRDQGTQLRTDIHTLFDKYLNKLIDNDNVRRQAIMAALVFRAQLLPQHRAEIGALAESSGLDLGDAMLANCFLDMLPAIGCSTITLPADASPDHIARFGRNLDFASLGVADQYSILLVFHPKDRYAFAAVTWPGLIGVLSGMNEHGLALCNMEVDRPMRLPQAMPYTLLYRTVLEQCRTVDQAIDLLNRTPRQSANNLMLMDAAGHRAVVEITPEKITVRRGRDKSALISTNHQRGQDQDTPGHCNRYDSLHDTAARTYGRIDVPAIQKMLNAVAQGNYTLQSMIFEPSTLTLYLATGANAPAHTWQRIDLKAAFAAPATQPTR